MSLVRLRHGMTGTVGGFAVAAILTGCVISTPTGPNQPQPDLSSGPSEGSSTAVPSAEPTLVPEGTAAENRALFDQVNEIYFNTNGNVIPGGRGVVDNLVTAGFAKGNMEVTADQTAIGLPVDSLVFSIRFDAECLIGQYSALGYSTIMAPALAEGNCLVGRTRTIDW